MVVEAYDQIMAFMKELLDHADSTIPTKEQQRQIDERNRRRDCADSVIKESCDYVRKWAVEDASKLSRETQIRMFVEVATVLARLDSVTLDVIEARRNSVSHVVKCDEITSNADSVRKELLALQHKYLPI